MIINSLLISDCHGTKIVKLSKVNFLAIVLSISCNTELTVPYCSLTYYYYVYRFVSSVSVIPIFLWTLISVIVVSSDMLKIKVI